MRNLLRRLFTYLDSNEKALFRGLWFFFVLPLVSWAFVRYAERDLTDGVSLTEGLVMALSLFIHFLSGKIIWNILNRERFTRVKDAVLVASGFWIIQLIIIVPAMPILVIISFFTQGDITTILGVLALLIPAFIGGCWIGFKKNDFIWQWCFSVSLPFSLPFMFDQFVNRGRELILVFPWFVLVIMGGYFFRGYLAELDPTRARREMFLSLEEQNDEGTLKKDMVSEDTTETTGADFPLS